MTCYNSDSIRRCPICNLPLLTKEDGTPDRCHNPTCCTLLCFCMYNASGELLDTDGCPVHATTTPYDSSNQ